jgi:serine protease AprX
MACGPNSIWGPNSHDEIVSVGTVNRELTNCDPTTPHVSSSRGPGEWAVKTTKPDCVAPTYGEVVWGTSTRRMRWWGTSGACPQVAGAAALILSIAPGLAPWNVGEIIRETCSWLPEEDLCRARLAGLRGGCGTGRGAGVNLLIWPAFCLLNRNVIGFQ